MVPLAITSYSRDWKATGVAQGLTGAYMSSTAQKAMEGGWDKGKMCGQKSGIVAHGSPRTP